MINNDLYLNLNKSVEPMHEKKYLDEATHLVEDKQNIKHHNLIIVIPLTTLTYAQNEMKSTAKTVEVEAL